MIGSATPEVPQEEVRAESPRPPGGSDTKEPTDTRDDRDPTISRDPDVHSGGPVFSGIRVPVETLVHHLEHGHTIDDGLEG